MKDQASNEHPKYAELETKRDVFRAVKSTDTIRATGVTNLPQYPGEDKKDYEIRKDASTIDGIVWGGVDTLCGSVFDGEINISKVNEKLKPYLENVDNKGNHFNIFARNAFQESFEGFSLILVDMPTGKADDLAQQKALGLRPYLNLYTAANVINWRFRVNPVSKQKELVLLVLKEVSSEPSGRFSVKDVTRYRVFTFENGVVGWELWEEQESSTNKKEKDLIQIDTGTVEKVKGIPAAFIGDVCDDPKLLVESRLEIKAYQKESSFDAIEYLSVPLMLLIGRPSDQAGQPMKYGPSTVVDVPIGGDGKFIGIDSSGHDSIKGSFNDIKDFIKARVNFLIESATEKTATEVVTNDKAKQARLIVWADELKDALERALQFMGQFVGLGSDQAGSIQLMTSWSKAKLTMSAEDVTAEANLVTEGLESLRTFVEKRHAAGLLPEDVDVDEEMERIDKEMKDNVGIKPVVEAGKMPNEKTGENKTAPTEAIAA